MRHRRDEIVFEPIELGEPLVGLAQLCGRRLQFARLLLELMTIDDHLRRLVENIAHLVYRKRFFLDYRSHHDARGGGADRSGELDFDVVHQLCVGDQTRIGPVKAFGA